jgi:O-antigen/teichoic acid export membrane protein
MGILKDLLRNGLRGTWVEVVVLMYSRASYFVLDSLGSVALGIYALADKVTMPVLRISGPVSGTVLPMFAELAAKGDFKELRAFYLRVMRKLIGFVVVAAVVVNLAIPWIIRGWFPEYTASIPLIHVLFVGVCFMVSNQISVACLSGLGRFGLVAVIATINLCVYAVGAWLWVEPYRELGAALATTVMEGTNMLTQIVFVAVTIRKLERQALNRAT